MNEVRLSEAQKQIVGHRDGAALVTAGPGTGKTRVITERVRTLLQTPNRRFKVLALTFTNKAAAEMRGRLKSAPEVKSRAFVGTFHGFCAEVLSSRSPVLGWTEMPTVFELRSDREALLGEAIVQDPRLEPLVRGDTRAVGRLLDAISEAKRQLLRPDDVENADVAEAYRLYEAALASCNAIDFDDLILRGRELFLISPPTADFYRRQYEYVCIDEGQDMSFAQYELLAALCGTEHKNVMIVGDPRQAIFGWAGGSLEFLDRFRAEFNPVEYTLSENFRSCRSVVLLANEILPDAAIEASLPVVGKVLCFSGRDEQDEALRVVETLNEIHEFGHPDIEENLVWSDFAVIGRNRFALRATEQALMSAGIPISRELSSQIETSSDEMEDFATALRCWANVNDRHHRSVLAKRWKVDLSESAEVYFAEQLRQAAVTKSQARIAEAVDAIRPDSLEESFRVLEALPELISIPQGRALFMDDLEDWRGQWDRYVRSTSGGRSVRRFLSDVALGRTAARNSGDGVSLLTAHSAKGLEFLVVALAGLADGVFPDYRATSARRRKEEDRSAFVAVTRARRVLIASYARSRVMPWGDPARQLPSRYFTMAESVSSRF